jgi:hypothetical protein
MATPKYIRHLQKNLSDNCCRDTNVFFSKLASKILIMSETINERINIIKSQVCTTSHSGVLLASIEAPVMAIGVKYEYIEYIKIYGPPDKGIFDEAKLTKIRNNLGITNINCL